MVAGFFTGGVEIYAYALQPYLLSCGATRTHGIAGLVAASSLAQESSVACSRGIPPDVPRRTSALLIMESVAVGMLALIGLIHTSGP
jgi:hypothetical protein